MSQHTSSDFKLGDLVQPDPGVFDADDIKEFNFHYGKAPWKVSSVTPSWVYIVPNSDGVRFSYVTEIPFHCTNLVFSDVSVAPPASLKLGDICPKCHHAYTVRAMFLTVDSAPGCWCPPS